MVGQCDRSSTCKISGGAVAEDVDQSARDRDKKKYKPNWDMITRFIDENSHDFVQKLLAHKPLAPTTQPQRWRSTRSLCLTLQKKAPQLPEGQEQGFTVLYEFTKSALELRYQACRKRRRR